MEVLDTLPWFLWEQPGPRFPAESQMIRLHNIQALKKHVIVPDAILNRHVIHVQ